MIEIIGSELNQWDIDRSVKVTGIVASHVHLANQGDSSAAVKELSGDQVQIPCYLLQTGKPLCVYAVQDGVTIERKVFSVRKRERPADYVYADEQRNFIYALITDAQDATEAANQAATAATQAGQSAVDSASVANQAATEANKAAEDAEKASENANEAAAKAAHTAKSLMVVGTASGENIVLDDAIDQYLVGCRIFGKTTQDGTPTPDAPVDLVSVENPTVSVNEQSMVVPYTLHGIPVSSGGNYTDANGQQWICDEVDFARGVYVRRIDKMDLGRFSWYLYKDSIFYSIDANIPARDGVTVDTDLLCSIYAPDKMASDWQYVSTNGVLLRKGAAVANFYSVCVKDTRYTTVNEFSDAVSGVPIYYVLATPIETPLSEDELAAFAALQTSRGITTVSNDAGAYMEIQYVMDAKKYIDSLVGSGGGSSTGIVDATVE